MFVSSTLIWTVLTILLIYLSVKLYYYIRVTRKHINAIPGPSTRPLVGNLWDMLLPTDKLWILLREWSTKYHPIFKLWLTPIYHGVVLLHPDDIEILLSTPKHISKSKLYELLGSWLGTGLLTSTGAKWQSRRKILTPAFHFNILQQFVDVFKEQSEVLVERLEQECDKNSTDVLPIVTDFTLRSICETAMGTSLNPHDKKQQDYVRRIYRLGELVVQRVLSPWAYTETLYFFQPAGWEVRRLIKKLHNFSMGVIKERQLNFNEDILKINENDDVGSKKRLAMLDLLIAAQRLHGNIDDEGIREEVDTFMFEGHDTTAMGISFALLLLANHQEVQRKVVQELDKIFGDSDRRATYNDLQAMNYLEIVLKESLRMYPSVPLIGRITDDEFKTHSGYVIPSGTYTHVFIYDLHHNPDIYPEPEKFIPERFLPENTQKRHPFAYLPFSAGPRNCIGQKFAMLELKSCVSSILRRFKLEAIDTPETVQLMMDIIIRPKNGIKIKFTQRK